MQVASNKDAGFTSESDIDWANIEPILYIVGIDGTLTLKDPTKQVYWQATSETLYIRAWCAGTGEKYTDIPMPGNNNTWSTPKDQSTSEALKQADFLFAYRSMTFEERTVNAGLEFSHLTSRITINLKSSNYLKQYDPAKVSVFLATTDERFQAWFFDGSFKGSGSELNLFEKTAGNLTTITPFELSAAGEDYYASYEAIVIPQGVIGTKGIEVKVGNATYQWAMELSDGATQLKSGYEYTFDITVKEQGLEVSAGSSISWGEGGSGSGNVTLPIEIDLSQATDAIRINDNKTYLLTGIGSKPVKINGDAIVILQGVSLSATGNAISVESGNPTIHVKGTSNSVTGTNAGIYVAQGSTLTITGDSRDEILSATGGKGSCGIGGYVQNASPYASYPCGDISITNVTVICEGSIDKNTGSYAPGIGNAGNATCGTITIDNATVYAYGYGDGTYPISAPAIGCGVHFSNGCPSSIPVVIIRNHSEIHAYRGKNNNDWPTDYIGWPVYISSGGSNTTAANSTINCGEDGGVYDSTIYCYTGDTPDKTVVYDENGNEL